MRTLLVIALTQGLTAPANATTMEEARSRKRVARAPRCPGRGPVRPESGSPAEQAAVISHYAAQQDDRMFGVDQASRGLRDGGRGGRRSAAVRCCFPRHPGVVGALKMGRDIMSTSKNDAAAGFSTRSKPRPPGSEPAKMLRQAMERGGRRSRPWWRVGSASAAEAGRLTRQSNTGVRVTDGDRLSRRSSS